MLFVWVSEGWGYLTWHGWKQCLMTCHNSNGEEKTEGTEILKKDHNSGGFRRGAQWAQPLCTPSIKDQSQGPPGCGLHWYIILFFKWSSPVLQCLDNKNNN